MTLKMTKTPSCDFKKVALFFLYTFAWRQSADPAELQVTAAAGKNLIIIGTFYFFKHPFILSYYSSKLKLVLENVMAFNKCL